MSGCHRQTTATPSTSSETTATATKTGGGPSTNPSATVMYADTRSSANSPSWPQRQPSRSTAASTHTSIAPTTSMVTATGRNDGGAYPARSSASRPPWSKTSRAPSCSEAQSPITSSRKTHSSTTSSAITTTSPQVARIASSTDRGTGVEGVEGVAGR